MKFFNNFKIYPSKMDFKLLFFKLFLFYLILLVILFIFQRRVMYFPNTDMTISEHWIPIKNNNHKIIALKEKEESKLYNVILFHGNAGNADMKNYYKLLFPNANIIIAEYPGFGFRANESLNKSNIISASQEIVEEILKDGKPIILLGESLGSGVASEMAIKYNIKNLVLATPYNDIASVAQSKFQYFPIYPLVLDRYNNKDVLKKFQGNLVILIAEFDQVIPTEFAYDLSKSIKSDINKLDILIKGAGHNSYISDLTEENRKQIHNFLNLEYF